MPETEILITGATGLLGGAVLFQALRENPDLRWTALSRGASEGHARARIAARLARFSDAATGTALAARLHVIPGDIFAAAALPGAVLARTTHVLHLAADTSFASKESNWRVNFDGTMALAGAAAGMPRLSRFLHCSTATICGGGASTHVLEAEYPREDVAHLVHYTHAKAQAEMALAQRFPQLPVVVARPSIVAGHSTLGARPSTSIFWFLRAVEALGLTSCEPTGGIDVVPSDWTAAALLHLLFKPELAARRYHLSAGIDSRAHWPEMLRAFAAARGPDAAINPASRFDMARPDVLRRRFRACFGHGDARLALMLRACRKYYEFCALDVTFDNAALLAEGMAPPPAMPEYLATCLANPPGQSVFDAFLEDADMFLPETTATTPAMAAE